MDATDWVLAGACALLAPVALFTVYMMFVIAPVSLYTEAECLRKGYPRYTVTVGLSRYCMNLEGTVTVDVEAL